MYTKYRKAIFELVAVLAGSLAVFILAGWFDLAESVVKHIEMFEKYEIDEFLSVFLYLVIAFLILALRRLQVMKEMVHHIERKNDELKKAACEIKVLKQILPICMHCKKIRNENDEWERLESYISNRTESRFSHGICPQCAEIHFEEELAFLKSDKGR